MNLSAMKREAIKTMDAANMSRESIAKMQGVSVRVVTAVLDGVQPHLQSGAKPRDTPRSATLSRFGHAKIEVERSVGLQSGHPALSEARTIFPSQVVGTLASPRFLVSGHNNPKLGKQVLKGDRAGWPIFHLTLEERATCPRSCAQWACCYGNAMPYARRHRPDAAFLENLRAELQQLQRQNPEGFLVRLHTLGDFYSLEYVLFWASALAEFPALHAFGYTARRVGDADPLSHKIAQAIAVLTRWKWDRFAIRTSHTEAGAERSIVVDAPPEAHDVLLCPAQTEKTAACATCGLCWAEAARDKTIAFLKHGMKRRRRSEPAEVAPAPAAAVESAPVVLPPPRTEPPRAAPRPQARATPRGAHFQNLGEGVSVIRMKPVGDRIAAWSRAYLARGGVSIDELADLFGVDVDQLRRAVQPAARAA